MGVEKYKHRQITPEFLAARAARNESLGHNKQKWIIFCEALLLHNFILTLYEPDDTLSKYIVVKLPGSTMKPYKVRFSNHKPNRSKQKENDCDFYVGISHGRRTNYNDAIMAVYRYYGVTNGR